MTRGAKVKVKVRDNVCNLSLYLFHFNTLLFTEENTLLLYGLNNDKYSYIFINDACAFIEVFSEMCTSDLCSC